MGRLSAMVDPILTRTKYYYDQHGNLQTVLADSTDEENYQESDYYYDNSAG